MEHQKKRLIDTLTKRVYWLEKREERKKASQSIKVSSDLKKLKWFLWGFFYFYLYVINIICCCMI